LYCLRKKVSAGDGLKNAPKVEAGKGIQTKEAKKSDTSSTLD